MKECLERPADFLRRLGTTTQGARLPLAEAALAFAILDRPALDPERGSRPAYLAHLDELALAVSRESGRGIAALTSVIAGSFGYQGDEATYDDLANADLMRVIDRRRGLPVTLGILYLHAARAQGWRAVGLAFPGQFLIRVETGVETRILDPFEGGRICEVKHIAERVAALAQEMPVGPQVLEAVGDRQVLLRLQNNIKSRLFAAEAYDKAEGVLERMLWVAPEDPALWRDSGMIEAMAGRYGAALAAFGKALAFETNPTVREGTESMLRHLRSQLN